MRPSAFFRRAQYTVGELEESKNDRRKREREAVRQQHEVRGASEDVSTVEVVVCECACVNCCEHDAHSSRDEAAMKLSLIQSNAWLAKNVAEPPPTRRGFPPLWWW